MELKGILEKLHQSKEFKDWEKEHGDAFLAHGFMLLDEANKDSWQIGYFSPDKDSMTTFVVSERFVETVPDQEILKSEHGLKELKPDDIKVGHEKALSKADEYHHLHHPREVSLKKFFIIQQFHDEPVYNVTFFFQSLKTLNIKISATTGEITHHTFQTLMEFDKK